MSSLPLAILEKEFRQALFELALEPEDLCEPPPHPETRQGEVYLGEMHIYRVRDNTAAKDYSSSLAMQNFKTRRLGKARSVSKHAAGYYFKRGFSWPVFAEENEVNAFLN